MKTSILVSIEEGVKRGFYRGFFEINFEKTIILLFLSQKTLFSNVSLLMLFFNLQTYLFGTKLNKMEFCSCFIFYMDMLYI